MYEVKSMECMLTKLLGGLMTHKQLALTDWEFRACGEDKWFPAIVPGTVHTDLLRNGLIPQPFYGKNEHELQWIDKKDWEYRAVLQLDEDWQSLTVTELNFAGLDTYADVYVNNVHALSADNMFLAWTVDVKGLLRTGENEILVKFRSVVKRTCRSWSASAMTCLRRMTSLSWAACRSSGSACLPAKRLIITAGTGARAF